MKVPNKGVKQENPRPILLLALKPAQTKGNFSEPCILVEATLSHAPNVPIILLIHSIYSIGIHSQRLTTEAPLPVCPAIPGWLAGEEL
jgi:hypothetical protein